MRIVVADTGPLHYLVLIDAISVLAQLFESVMIPVTVRNEMLLPRTPEILRQWILHAPDWLDIVPDPAPEPDASLARLDGGERCAVQLALSVNASLVLMDDRAGVLAAERKGLLVTGPLGILDLAANRGLLDIKVSVQRLTATNFRYSQALDGSIVRTASKEEP
jgi:predicted nucleic acid-binding protein